VTSQTAELRFSDGSYDVKCPACGRTLCQDQPFRTAERLATSHDEAFHRSERS